jgi:hypothetical protein
MSIIVASLTALAVIIGAVVIVMLIPIRARSADYPATSQPRERPLRLPGNGLGAGRARCPSEKSA